MAQIIFDHVTKKFGDETALENVSFEIEKGERRFCFCARQERCRKEYPAESDHEAGGSDFRTDHGQWPPGGHHEEKKDSCTPEQDRNRVSGCGTAERPLCV